MATDEAALPRAFPRFRELDGVRGIAALLVFFHHLCSASIQPEHWGSGVLALRFFFHYADSGVDIFFVLSGFLISSLLIRDRKSDAYYHDFYWKRALRILPLYLICLICVFLFIPHNGGYVLLSALFIANFANVFHIPAMGPFWSLAIEEQFYLLWPTVVRRRSVSTLSRWALAIAASTVILRFVAASVGHYNYFLTPLRCDGLAVGALIACRFEHRQRHGIPLSIDNRFFVGAILSGLLFCALPAIFSPIASHIAFALAFIKTGETLLCGGILGLFIAHTESKALAPFRSRLLTFFGLISYAFYMVHLYVLYLYDQLRGQLIAGDTRGYVIRILVVLVGSVAVSLFSRYLIELPALSLRKHVLKRGAPAAETEVSLFTPQ